MNKDKKGIKSLYAVVIEGYVVNIFPWKYLPFPSQELSFYLYILGRVIHYGCVNFIRGKGEFMPWILGRLFFSRKLVVNASVATYRDLISVLFHLIPFVCRFFPATLNLWGQWVQ